jgi:hypothetical protein
VSGPGRDGAATERLCLASGIVAGALYLAGAAIFVGVVVPVMPALDAPPAVRVAFYAAMGRSVAYRGVSYLGQLQLFFLLPFLGALVGVLRRAERGSGALAWTVFAAGVALALIPPFAMLLEDHLLLGLAAAQAEPAVVNAVDGLVPLSFALAGFPQALVLAGTSALLARVGIIGRWLARAGLVVGALSLAGTGTLVWGAMFPASHLASLLFRVWLIALCIALLRSRVDRRSGGIGLRSARRAAAAHV